MEKSSYPEQAMALQLIALQKVVETSGVKGTVVAAEGFPQGRSRENWKVQLAEQEKPIVVSLFPRQNHKYTPAYQAQLQQELYQAGVKVPGVLGFRAGENAQYPAIISEFDEGIYHQTLSEQQLAVAADTIAKFHASTGQITPPTEADYNPQNDSLKTREDSVKKYLDRLNQLNRVPNEVTTKSMIEFKKNTENKERNLPKGLTHGDIRPENFLFSEDNNSMTLLDFERTRHGGELLFDLATFITKSIVIAEIQHQKPPKHEEKIAAFLKSYHEKRPLTAEELDALPEYLQSRTFYVTALRSGLEKEKPDLYVDIDTGLNIQATLQEYLSRTNFKDMLGVDEKAQTADRFIANHQGGGRNTA